MCRPDFGELVRERRLAKKLTLKGLAKEINDLGVPISLSRIWDIENEWIVPRVDIIAGLITVLNLTTREVEDRLGIKIKDKLDASNME